MAATTLYVLKLRNDKWYVGTTTRPVEMRWCEHAEGTGSQWTKLHRPMSLHDHRMVPLTQDAAAIETKETCKLMLVHGVNNVRGGPYVSPQDYTQAEIEMMITPIGHALEMRYDAVRQKLGMPARTTPTLNQSSGTEARNL